MRRRKPPRKRSLLLCIAGLGLVATAKAESLMEAVGDLSFLKSDEVIITLLASTVLLLFGVLLRLRQMRVELQHKSAALEKSARHIRLMGDNLPSVAIFQITYTEEERFHFTYLSKGYDRILGFDRDQVVADAQLAYDHVYEEDLPVLIQVFEESRNNMTPVNFELRVLDVSGQLKWLNVSAVPHMDQHELIWDGFVQDISMVKHVEDALVEENRNFQNLFETIDDFLLICDMDGRLLHSNPSVITRLGYTKEELKNMSVFELYSEDHRPEVYRVIARMQTELTTTSGLPLRMKSGGSIPVEMNVFQGHWKNKKAIFGVARDIASRQQTESALRESQQMLQLIMDTIPMSVFWKDKDSIYLGCNKAFIRECGLQNYDDVVGKSPIDLFPPEMAPGVIERDQEVIRNNHPMFNFTQSHTRIDGSIGWREISKIPLRDDSGRAVGVLGVWRDVTEQNRAEDRLKRTLEDMERFNQLMRGRERRTLELKAEINNLLKELGQTKKYRTTTDDL
ncbi:PAS domain S-box protein [Pontiellaceae bacterium B12227]|nr:PAS domain S-box protein [Pontiellaceae bacterium B12227]